MRLRAFTALALLLIGSAAVWTRPPQNDPAAKKQIAPATASSLRKLLDSSIQIPEEFKQPVPFRLVCKHFGDVVNLRGESLPIWINQNAFRLEGGADAPDLLDTNVVFPTFLKTTKIRSALEIGISQFPGQNGSYLIRADHIEITTTDRTKIHFVLDEGFAVDFRAKPVRQVLEEVSDRTGLSIGVNAELAEILTKTFDLRSNGDMSVRGVLECLADSYGLKLVTDQHRIFLTSQDQYMQRMHMRLAEAEIRKKIADLGEPVRYPSVGDRRPRYSVPSP